MGISHIFLQSAKDERSLFVGAVALCLHAWHNQVVEKAKQENNLISVTRANHNEVVLEKNNPLERTFTTWTVKTADKNLKKDKDYSLLKGNFQTLLTFLYKDVINKDKKDRTDSKPPIDSLFNNNLTKKRPFNYCMVEKMAYVPNLKSHGI